MLIKEIISYKIFKMRVELENRFKTKRLKLYSHDKKFIDSLLIFGFQNTKKNYDSPLNQNENNQIQLTDE